MLLTFPRYNLAPGPGPDMTTDPKTANPPEQVMVTPLEQLNEHAKHISCPYCHQITSGRIVKEGDSMQT